MNHLQVPQKGPYGEEGPPTGHFAYLSKTSSFGLPSKGALPEAPFMEPLESACRITKATDTHSEHTIIIAFAQEQWLRERALKLPLHVYCLYCLFLNPILTYNQKGIYLQITETFI